MPTKHRRPDLTSRRADLALLLAGQVRTFREKDLQNAIFNNVVRPTGATVFAHLSPEATYANWYFGHAGRNLSRSQDAQESLISVGQSDEDFIRSFTQQYRPAFAAFSADTEMHQHPLWTGAVLGDASPQSVLFFRWLVLHEQMVDFERTRVGGVEFAFVLRLRPDALVRCILDRETIMQWLSVHHAVHDAYATDFSLLMRREVAKYALTVYATANTTSYCTFKVELCVPGALISRDLDVGIVDNFTALVRSPATCKMLQNSRSPVGHIEEIACGRRYLEAASASSTGLGSCAHERKVLNHTMSAKVRPWCLDKCSMLCVRAGWATVHQPGASTFEHYTMKNSTAELRADLKNLDQAYSKRLSCTCRRYRVEYPPPWDQLASAKIEAIADQKERDLERLAAFLTACDVRTPTRARAIDWTAFQM